MRVIGNFGRQSGGLPTGHRPKFETPDQCASLPAIAPPPDIAAAPAWGTVESSPSRRSNLAENYEQYRAAIDRARAEDSPELRKRMNAVAGASWDARFQETVVVVNGLIAGM